MKTIKVTDWNDVPENFTGIVILKNGDKCWIKNKRLHRTDGPAIEYGKGTEVWYLERSDGSKYEGYYINEEPTTKEAAELYGHLFKEETFQE